MEYVARGERTINGRRYTSGERVDLAGLKPDRVKALAQFRYILPSSEPTSSDSDEKAGDGEKDIEKGAPKTPAKKGR